MNRRDPIRCRASMFRSILRRLGVLAVALAAAPLFAMTERITDYRYDSAGNIVRIATRDQNEPPRVDRLEPGFVNIGRTINVLAIGVNLLGARVDTTVPGLTISNVDAEFSAVSFRLSAQSAAPLGTAQLRFTTGLGVAFADIVVAERPPAVTTMPTPIAIPEGNRATTIEFTFSDPRPDNEVYAVAIGDPTVAEPDTASLSVPKDATRATLTLTGRSIGSTDLRLTLPEKFFFYSFPVFVNASFVPSLGDQFVSDPVGVLVRGDPTVAFDPDTLVSPGVGVQVGGLNPTISRAVGVQVGDDFASPLLSPSVGVQVGGLPTILSRPVGVTYGD